MTRNGLILLDTLFGLALITVTLMSASIIVQQGLSTTRTFSELREHYFEACNDVNHFRQTGSTAMGHTVTTPHGTFYSVSIFGEISFEAIK